MKVTDDFESYSSLPSSFEEDYEYIMECDDVNDSDDSDTSGGKFEPAFFLRCHSKVKVDSADKNTAVWQCAFEPDPEHPGKTTKSVATCGSNSVCVINVENGKVRTKYYAKKADEVFYSVAWTTLMMKQNDRYFKTNILAVGGLKRTLHLLHPSYHVCFFEKELISKKEERSSVNLSSLIFHPYAKAVLCGSFSDGEVRIWDIGQPSLPDYEVQLKTLHTLNANNEIFELSFSAHCEVLLAATTSGVFAWSLGLKDVNSANSELEMWNFKFQADSPSQSPPLQLVDSVQAVQDGRVLATKCSLHGTIYLWDLELALSRGKEVWVMPDHVLEWSDSDKCFMSMSSHSASGILACGDDRGCLWLYDVIDILSRCVNRHPPSTVIQWPEVSDQYSKSQSLLSQDSVDIVVNKVVVNHSGKYIVAVTNTNLVCIWKKEALFSQISEILS